MPDDASLELRSRSAPAKSVQPPAPPAPLLSPTVFHEEWWLQAASGGKYRESQVVRDGKIVGRLPYIFSWEYGGKSCAMPRLTHFLGPAVDEGDGSDCTRTLRHFEITRELIQGLPNAACFYQRFHRFVPDTLMFQEAGFSTEVLFTSEIAPAPEAELWSRMRDKTRNVIRRAREQVEVSTITDPSAFVDFYHANLRSRGLRSYYDEQVTARVCQEALIRGRGCILQAKAGSRLEAAIFYVWDSRTAYYLLSTRSAESANGSVALLLWEALRDTAGRNLTFDMDGISSPGSRLFYAGFGGRMSPRFIVSRISYRQRALRRLAGLLSRQPN